MFGVSVSHIRWRASRRVLYDFQVGIGVITEIRLSFEEVNNLILSGRRIENLGSLVDSAHGGVCIVVVIGTAC